ncbi:SOS response-associated peptidase [Clostridium polynesiense]|uniref:SOS response-associated peptidase n=1 Tax=Clostridium polynesiense TaxID=1325933 RepID=UPI0006943B27|nr:SOS response-associated peptidase [Clostridium polynesiense]
MCGRFQLDFSMDDLKRYLMVIDELKSVQSPQEKEEIKPELSINDNAEIIQGVRYPDNKSAVVTPEGIKAMSWGFPFNKKLIINARGETVFEKRMYSKSILQKRCLIPANLFFEWKDKVKYEISLKDENIFSMAGIYNLFHMQDGSLQERYVIITTSANKDMEDIHHRMPVILPKNLEKDYLNLKTSPIEIQEMLIPYAEGRLIIESTNKAQQLKLF